MSLFGALFTGVSGLSTQSQSTAMIANNIANVNTVGFKRSEASFYSLVTTEGRSSKYSPGTVAVNRIQRVNQQGSIQQTGSTTDAAISGNGFFAVKRDATSQQEMLYTRSGSFSEDAQGLLRNTAGFVLYGWPLDATGALPANQGDLTSLVPADVAFLGGLTRPTSTAELSLNLNSSEVDSTLAQATPGTNAPDFTRGLTVYDSLGGKQVLTFEYTKVYGPEGTAAGNVNDLAATSRLVTDLGLSNLDQFSISVDGGAATTFTVVSGTPVAAGQVQTMNDLLTQLNAITGVNAFLGNDGELVIQRDEFQAGTESIAISNVTGTPLTGLGLVAGQYASTQLTNPNATVTTGGLTGGLTPATTLAALGIANGQTIQVSVDGAAPVVFTATVPGDTVATVTAFLGGLPGVTASLNALGQLIVQHSNPGTASISFAGSTAPLAGIGLASASATAVNYDNGTPTDSPPYSTEGFPAFQNLPTPPNTAYNERGWWQVRVVHPNGTTLSNGLINFNSDGTMNALRDASGNIDINLTNIDWGNGSAPQQIDVDIEKFSQFSGNYNVIFSDQNGAELGLRTGVEITRDGFVVARFSNGASARLYKVPLITFANTNGLTEVSGTAYSENELSGEENLREAGTGGAGFLEPSTVESSNVDLADEFSKLIVSQRAYSANTRVISTVDQMTEDLLRLR